MKESQFLPEGEEAPSTQRSQVTIEEEEFVNEKGEIERRKTVSKKIIDDDKPVSNLQPPQIINSGITPPAPLTDKMKSSNPPPADSIINSGLPAPSNNSTP